MITYYCPQCWTILNGQMANCPECGYELSRFSELPYEDKLLISLHHPVQDNRIMAIEILGNTGSRKAIPEFEQILAQESEDYYVLRAVLLAASKIGGAQGVALLERAQGHSSSLVQRLAKRLLAEQRGKPTGQDPQQSG
ncbi:MAG: HEAT repeat domain-containing protein [Chloroflexi bacterium]|nr:HEAT repeat domain-containing protein [Chloroflexota bacterium]